MGINRCDITRAVAVAVFAMGCMWSVPAHAESIIGLTTANQLISFDSATPGSATSPLAVTGLLGGDLLVGIDRRPAVGLLYGVGLGAPIAGATSRIYTIDPLTGVAILVSSSSTNLTGSSFGIDFNPVVDRLRVVSDADQNLRINVDTGVSVVDTPLAYAVGDPNVGANPNIVAVAYSNNVGGASTTVLRGIDSGLDILVTQNPPNNGTLNTQFPLGVNLGALAGYDISGLTGTPYAAFVLEGSSTSGFYTLSGSGATLVGNLQVALVDIAAPVGVPEPGTLSLLAVAAFGLAALRRRRTVRL